MARSTTRTDAGFQGSPAQSEGEYAGIFTGSVGECNKLAVDSLVEDIRGTHEEHLEGVLGKLVVFRHENAGSGWATKWHPTPGKYGHSTTSDAADHVQMAALTATRQASQSSGKDGANRGVWILRSPGNEQTLRHSSPGVGGVTCSIASLHSEERVNSPITRQWRLSTLFPDCCLVSVGSRRLMVVHVLGVAKV